MLGNEAKEQIKLFNICRYINNGIILTIKIIKKSLTTPINKKDRGSKNAI